MVHTLVHQHNHIDAHSVFVMIKSEILIHIDYMLSCAFVYLAALSICLQTYEYPTREKQRPCYLKFTKLCIIISSIRLVISYTDLFEFYFFKYLISFVLFPQMHILFYILWMICRSHSFYLSDGSPVEYTKGQNIEVRATKTFIMDPHHSDIYYSLNIWTPINGTSISNSGIFDQIFSGERIVKSP